MTQYINGEWVKGYGPVLDSIDPANGDVIWSSQEADPGNVNAAFNAAHMAFGLWSRLSLQDRLGYIYKFKDLARVAAPEIAELISRETGKLLWDSSGEGGAIANKVDISVKSYQARTGRSDIDTTFGQASLRHRPHGVMAVLGPYNFPAHLPNGQIIPALIAGNTVVFKPSELTPATGERLVKIWDAAGCPPGVINLVQGGRDTGAAILAHPHVDGVLFTGSAKTGAYIHKLFGGRPEVMLALEMGGNNPLIIWDAVDIDAAASLAIQSAFITSGQRCTCARRLIIPNGITGEIIIESIIALIDRMGIGAWNDSQEAAIGPVISARIGQDIITASNGLVEKGAIAIRAAKAATRGDAFITPGLYDVTGCDIEDEEIFGPILQVIRVDDWESAVAVANNTRFGLAAGLISNNLDLWDDFRRHIRAGIVNFNRPTTGAASTLPFGGPGASGNHNPGAFYAADFCAWPMASQVSRSIDPIAIKGLK